MAERAAQEQALSAAGVRLPVQHRERWSAARRGISSLWVPLATPAGVIAAAFAAELSPSRALPGYRLLRVERFGESIARALWPAAVGALTKIARQRRVLRLSVEVYSRDDATRAALGALLGTAGFTRAPSTRNWSHTLVTDLQPSETDLLAGLSMTARQGVRALTKLPVEVRPITDPTYAPRLDALAKAAFARTGGHDEERWNWPGVIELSQHEPDASRLAGLFRTDRTGVDALLGFAWGWSDGASASYAVAGSSRPTDLKVSVGYPLVWDLIVWAKQSGAAWFDLGGVIEESEAAAPTGGISDFKRRFSKLSADVADDWVLEPHWLPARVATIVSRGARWLQVR